MEPEFEFTTEQIGQKKGRLTLVERRKGRVVCRCDCGADPVFRTEKVWAKDKEHMCNECYKRDRRKPTLTIRFVTKAEMDRVKL